MAVHDYVISNGTGAAVRSDLNGALAAIVSQNSSATEPSPTYAYQRWADTTAGVMKMRNGANNAWITLYQLDGEWTSIAFENGTAAAPSIYFKDSGTDTGIYSPGADQVGISTGGIGRITIDGSGNVNIDSNTLYVDAATNRVGIGTNSPQAVCHVSLGNILLSNAYYLASRNAADNASLSLIGRDTSNNVIIDPDGYGIKVGGTTLVTTSAGRLGIGTTPSNANGGILQLSSGITFPATAVAASDANTLDDYEEGTWTPAFVAQTGTLGTVTYDNVQGVYTKIGKLVTVTGGFYCTAFAAGTGSGDLRISGLPFANIANQNAISVGDSRLWPTNNPTGGQISASVSSVILYYRTTANGVINNIQVSDAATGSGALNLVYFTASYQTS